jgi:thiosulfate dehydrogenase
LASAGAIGWACGDGGRADTTAAGGAADRGRQLFTSAALSKSGLNLYSCATCHDAVVGETPLVKPGAVLAGATLRSSYWGGQEADLLGAINQCRAQFMHDPEPLLATSNESLDLYDYLLSLEPGDSASVEFSTPRLIDDPLERGDADRGHALYQLACQTCHGEIGTGLGRSSLRIAQLPEDALIAHEDFTPRLVRLVFIEKVRHGNFFGYGGEMPPFSTQVLSDVALADVLEALGATGE